MPAPSIGWTRTGVKNLIGNRYIVSNTTYAPFLVTDGSNEVFQATGNLTIMNVRRGDTGVYSCLVMNVVNRVQSDASLTVLCK